MLKVEQDYFHIVLVDTDITVDVLFKRVIEVFGLRDSVKASTTTITGFNVSKEPAMGKITLPVQAGPETAFVNFVLINAESKYLRILGMNGVQLYTIVHFGGDIVRPKIGVIVTYVGGSTKLTSLRVHSSYKDFVTLLEEASKIHREDWLSTTKDTGSGRGLSTTKAGGSLRHNSFPDPKPEYRGYPETNGRGIDPHRFGPFEDDENDSFETICTDVPPSNEPSIHLSNEHVLTNVPPSNEPMLTNVPHSIEPEPIIGQTKTSDSETTESWSYFLEMFGSNFHGYDTRFVVISDRNPGIINIVPKVFSFTIHTFCAFHISNNIKTTLESMRIVFRMAAEALTNIDFDKHMNDIRNAYPVGLQYILGIPKETWSNLYIPKSSCMISFVIGIRSFGILLLWEEAKKSQARLTPWATDHCESRKLIADSLTCKMVLVLVVGGKQWVYLVNTEYALWVLLMLYKAVYEPIWIPIRGIEQWKILKTDPRVRTPIPIVRAGRPRMQRKRREKISGLVTKLRFCSRCQTNGHNRHSCKLLPIPSDGNTRPTMAPSFMISIEPPVIPDEDVAICLH
ncbi:hypothetical protein GIB67_020468 [Kingdonia uniflora]|uniref:Uncharacterized protein n=1 Tax=Kingdonia uniflora TaxID=39325 RepID=A0A7J7LUX0_9MAGN|nr:hypothetical protein GIB67_020468 [Kingdonia uniflora]